MLRLPPNVNGRPNADIIKPWINALDVTRRKRGMFVIDFGIAMTESDASQYEAPFEYVRQKIKADRLISRDTSSKYWWRHQRPRPSLRNAIAKLTRYIVTPMVAKHRIFAWVDKATIPENLLVVISRSDDYFFGVLHSRMHELWSRSQGSQLREAESAQRYAPESTFDTFPFPWPPGKEPQDDPRVQRIAAAAKNLVELRDWWLNPPDTTEADLKKRTLTNLYNARPQWLQDAHRTLDEAVFAAYGWPADLNDQQILERLLALNHERAGATNPA